MTLRPLDSACYQGLIRTRILAGKLCSTHCECSPQLLIDRAMIATRTRLGDDCCENKDWAMIAARTSRSRYESGPRIPRELAAVAKRVGLDCY